MTDPVHNPCSHILQTGKNKGEQCWHWGAYEVEGKKYCPNHVITPLLLVSTRSLSVEEYQFLEDNHGRCDDCHHWSIFHSSGDGWDMECGICDCKYNFEMPQGRIVQRYKMVPIGEDGKEVTSDPNK